MISWSLIFWNALYAAINANAAAYCLIATGLNVHVGYTGLLNFGQAAFAAVGAYAFAIPIANYGWHWYFALPFVFLCSILLALLLGIPTLRLRADYLAIVTIAASEITRYLLGSTRFTWLTGGSDGKNRWTQFFQDLNPFPNNGVYNLGKQPIDGYRLFMLILGWGLVALFGLLVWALMRSPWGRVLKSIREDENAAAGAGQERVGLQDAEPHPRRTDRLRRRSAAGRPAAVGAAGALRHHAHVLRVHHRRARRDGAGEGPHRRHRHLLLRDPVRRQLPQRGHPSQ